MYYNSFSDSHLFLNMFTIYYPGLKLLTDIS